MSFDFGKERPHLNYDSEAEMDAGNKELGNPRPRGVQDVILSNENAKTSVNTLLAR